MLPGYFCFVNANRSACAGRQEAGLILRYYAGRHPDEKKEVLSPGAIAPQ